ncbi:MAG: hypothetical protein ACXW5U_02680 [Thermoanaerobaculia bacterium]
MDESTDPNADVVLTPKAGDVSRVLAPGDLFFITVRCRVQVDGTGFITNVARVRGGGSVQDTSSAQVAALARRDAERLEEAARQKTNGRRK